MRGSGVRQSRDECRKIVAGSVAAGRKRWYEQIEVICVGTGEWCGSLLVEYSASEGHAGESLFDDYSVRSRCAAGAVLRPTRTKHVELEKKEIRPPPSCPKSLVTKQAKPL